MEYKNRFYPNISITSLFMIMLLLLLLNATFLLHSIFHLFLFATLFKNVYQT